MPCSLRAYLIPLKRHHIAAIRFTYTANSIRSSINNNKAKTRKDISYSSLRTPISHLATPLLLVGHTSRGYMSQSYDPITRSECPEGKTVIIEGSASMLYDTSEAVFYNKVQVLNRDLSIRVISHFVETIMKERKEKVLKKQEVRDHREA